MVRRTRHGAAGEKPPPRPAAKAASDHERLLGDGNGDGKVDYWDLLYLWGRLTKGYSYSWVDWDLLDIDRDDDTDFDDLAILGKHLYEIPRPPNTYGIGQALVADDPIDDFTVEVRFVAGNRYTPAQKALFREAAKRWEAVITTEDLSDRDFSVWPWDSDNVRWWDEYWGNARGGRLRITDTIDDVRVYATTEPAAGYAGIAGPVRTRWENGLPVFGVVIINEDILTESNETSGLLAGVFLHEIAHVLGFGTIWEGKGLTGNSSKTNPTADTYFRGWRARRAFNDAGGRNYRGLKVPVHQGHDDGHWRESVFDDELMSPIAEPGRGESLSAISIQAMADIGYAIDLSQAEPYTLPPASKPVAVHDDSATVQGDEDAA